MWFKERNNFILHFEGFFQHWLPRVEFQIQWIHGVKCCLHWSQAPDSNVPFGGFTAARGGVLILVDSSCLKCLHSRRSIESSEQYLQYVEFQIQWILGVKCYLRWRWPLDSNVLLGCVNIMIYSHIECSGIGCGGLLLWSGVASGARLVHLSFMLKWK